MRHALLVVLAAVVTATCAFAHEGHTYIVMGTVSAIHENHLEVKGTDERTSVFTLNRKTKIFRGRAIVTASEIKKGDRVVVRAAEWKESDGKVTLVSTEVHLGPDGSSSSDATE